MNTPSHCPKPPVRRVVGLTAASLALACACGGAQRNHYLAASSRQEQCCNGLVDAAARSACLAELPKVEPAAQALATNQTTFACIDRHFQCDQATGRATQASAQAQLDCLTDLGAARKASEP